ncbi:hypothetical protein [Ilumatobacter sp.]|uniref:hypothetical protein n=1 Tax=Ilumatobacter sp. TaxID=1967498 RepID=UPI0037513938
MNDATPGDLSVDEQRAVVQSLTEEQLEIFDLLTQPEPVLDWRRKASASTCVHTTIKDTLYAGRPADPRPQELFNAKVAAVYDHVPSQKQMSGCVLATRRSMGRRPSLYSGRLTRLGDLTYDEGRHL